MSSALAPSRSPAGGNAATTRPSSGLVKAVIREKAGSTTLTCAFNPTAYTIAKSASWKETTTSSSEQAPEAEFLGTSPRTLTMQLMFDAWGAGTRSVAADVEQLLGWTQPTRESLRAGFPNPPVLTFAWGRNKYFDAYLSSATANFKLFAPDGTPLRATVDVVLTELPQRVGRQNPTSGSLPGFRTALVRADSSLQSIAQQEYGDPSLWRGLAAANRIDDPLRVRVGATLLVPRRDDVEELM